MVDEALGVKFSGLDQVEQGRVGMGREAVAADERQLVADDSVDDGRGDFVPVGENSDLDVTAALAERADGVGEGRRTTEGVECDVGAATGDVVDHGRDVDRVGCVEDDFGAEALG